MSKGYEVIDRASVHWGEVTDEELDELLKSSLKGYFKENFKKLVVKDDFGKHPDLVTPISDKMKDSNFVSLVTSYVSLQLQEKQTNNSNAFQHNQARTNLILQIMIIAVAALNVLATAAPYLWPHH